jgi:hypothetical protein
VVAFPVNDIRLDTRWLDLTKLSNASVPTTATFAGGLAHAAWNPDGDNRTVLEAGLSVENGEVDPAALYEAIENSGLITVRRARGTLASWPVAPASGEGVRAISLTLVDPDLSPPSDEPRPRRARAPLRQRGDAAGRGQLAADGADAAPGGLECPR